MDMLTVSSSPHIHHPDTTAGIMLDVMIALSPAAVFGCIIFGWRALLLLLVCIGTAVIAEYAWNKILKKPTTVGDFSAALTGLLLGMNLSSRVPVWVAMIGSAAAILVVKQMFGGLGHNFANPAITARIILLVSFPSFMTRYAEPVSAAITSATPLADDTGSYTLKMLFFGLHPGTIGETSAFLLLVGGLYLVIRRVISPVIPLAFIGTVGVLTGFTASTGTLSGAFSAGLSAVFSGGLMLGAIFMATDYVTSPTTLAGKAIFGFGAGLLTFIIRRFGALPEGVSYAILLMNILVPYIDRLTVEKPFGYRKAVDSHE